MSWRDSAACARMDIAVFFPAVPQKLTVARSVCARCPVRDDCLEFALQMPAAEDKSGIYAGTSARQRHVLRHVPSDEIRWDEKRRTYEPAVLLKYNRQTGRYETVSRSDERLAG